MAFTTTDGKIYITEVETRKKLEIQFVPEEIGWDRVANFSEVPIVGRNHPRYHFTGGKDIVTMEFDFYSDSELRNNVLQKVKWLQGLTYSDAGFGHVNHVKLTFGDMFRGKEFIVKSVKTKFSGFNAYFNLLPQQAYVQITFEYDAPKNLTRADARR